MEKVRLTSALLPVVSLLACLWARAQGIPQGFDVFAEFGPSCHSGAVNSGANGQAKCKTGRLFAGGRLRLTRHDAFEVSYSYSPNAFSYSPYFWVPTAFIEITSIRSRSMNYVRYLATNPHMQPFVTGGVGSEHLTGPYPYSLSYFAWNYGAGMDMVFRRYFALRLECRDYRTSLISYPTKNLHNIVPSVGIVFRFNRDPRL